MMVRNTSLTRRILTVDLPVLLILIFTLSPYLWMALTSVTQESKLFTEGPSLAGATLENYLRLFRTVGFGANLLDSFIVAGGTVIVGLALSVPAAYAFSRFRFKGRRLLMLQFLVINMFPLVLLILPLFILMKTLGLVDTYFALIIANSTVAIPFSVWMMTSYIDGIPRSLDEAAMTDGCTRFGALFRVVLPLCTPGIIATGVYIFITAWNEYLYALTLGGRSVKPITVAIQTLIGEYQVEWGLLTAGGIVGAMPATLLFLFIQKRLIAGMTQGAVKG
ncbi:carbohydrate ABC transporter permease [Marinovum sp. 2_MG-2023]|uniref:carbohydrate ABC transporter permease n=1 Tax=Roseobacteraceae TaxID=2854170 RepID=UPI001FD43B2F|nr:MULTISPECIES: carbohydrate ABC transporter permease [Roseobacteraceae]MCJ7874357.1 carbohydrate ABC transporter permease [Phaeobacter sp. J2-8]MDO6731299.1 carbohydrate ABC transporter permease [Marinovum sp. 2_MG-2023]MDO6780549.1 carbohydrate ABC transporter permease [Marinovum sp. 1_MG-2023]